MKIPQSYPYDQGTLTIHIHLKFSFPEVVLPILPDRVLPLDSMEDILQIPLQTS